MSTLSMLRRRLRLVAKAWVYAARRTAVRAFGSYNAAELLHVIRRLGWKSKIDIAGGLVGGINYFKLVVAEPGGSLHEARLPLRDYLQIVAATNFKQRVRKTLDYFHADRLNYAVVGTPNRLEYDQGFFVKVGEGAADLKPIAHLYKTQVYAMARALGLPEAICRAEPTTRHLYAGAGPGRVLFRPDLCANGSGLVGARPRRGRRGARCKSRSVGAAGAARL